MPLTTKLHIVVLSSLLFLCACGTQHTDLSPAGSGRQDPQQPLAFLDGAGLPDVAALSHLRTVSEQFDYTKLGSEALLRSPGSQVEGTDLRLDATAGGPGGGADFEWAVFSHTPGAETLIQATVNFTASSGAAFIGTADYSSEHWVWSGPFTSAQGVNLGFAGAVSGTGNCYIAVVAARGHNLALQSVVFLTEGGGTGLDIIEIDTAGDTGVWPSMLLVEGHPAIAYCDFNATALEDGDLMYVRANDPQGSTWGTPVLVDSSGDTGHEPSLVLVNGNPAICYHDFGSDTLLYVRAMDATGQTWNTPQTLRDSGSWGHYAEMEVVNGNPAIVHFNWDTDELNYMRADDADGAVWGADVLLDTLTTVDEIHPNWSLAVANGNPAVAYADVPAGFLKYVRASDANGTAWSPAVTIKPNGVQYVELEVGPDGRPCISYYNTSIGVLEFCRASNTDGSAWGAAVVVDDRSNTGLTSSMAFLDGKPALSYYSLVNGNLGFALSDDSSGASWSDLRTLDAVGDTGGVPDLLNMGDGSLAVAYTDIENYDLQYIAGIQ